MSWFRFGCRALFRMGIGLVVPLAVAFGPFFIGAARVDFSCPAADTVFVGDSTTEYSIDDTLVPGSCNFAHSASGIGLTTARLKRYLADNPQTKRVVFGWWPGLFVGKHVENYGAYATLKHLPMMRWRDIDDYSMLDWFRMFKAAFCGRARKIDPVLPAYAFTPRREYWGRYRPTDIARLSRQLAGDGLRPLPMPSVEAPDSWRAFVKVVHDADAQLILYRVPIYATDRRCDEAEVKAVLASWLPDGTKIVDLSGISIPDAGWRDMTHVNSIGAAIVSAEMRRRLEQ